MEQAGKRVLAAGQRPKAAVPGGQKAPEKPHRKSKAALIATAAVAVSLAAGYVGLCAWAGADRIGPNTTALGISLSGMSVEQAEQAVHTVLKSRLTGRSITLSEAQTGHSASLPCTAVTVDGLDEALEGALPTEAFLSRGAQYLGRLLAPTEIAPELVLSPEGEAELDAAVAQLSTDLEHPMVESAYALADGSLTVTKGTTGTAVDTQALKAGVVEKVARLLDAGGADLSVPVSLVDAPPPELDFESVYQELYVEPADAYFDKDSRQIVSSVTGVSFDIAAARALLGGAGEGESVQVPLSYTQPETTTEALSALLFRDVLSTSTTYCSGGSNRLSNIRTAAGKINGMILLPGESFSYNNTVGPYTVSSGYLAAGTYQSGKSVDALAGGICQLSSTLYWSTLRANLQIDERHNHQLSVGYLPDGCDATVWGGGPDFRFTNDTSQPLKIEASMSGRNLTVRLIGTNTTGQRAEVETVRLSSDPMRVVYKASSDVPAGTTRRDAAYPGHNGSVVESYRVVYNADGSVASRTLEATSRYARQDKVYLYNPNDGAPNAASGGVVSPTPAPIETPAPADTGTPSTAPAVEPPVQTADPTPDSVSTPSEPPAVETPAQAVIPEQPVATPEPPPVQQIDPVPPPESEISE